jgi:hypothetical protein
MHLSIVLTFLLIWIVGKDYSFSFWQERAKRKDKEKEEEEDRIAEEKQNKK